MKRSAMRRSQPKRDWTSARDKVEREGACRLYTVLTPASCEGPVEAAHIAARSADAYPEWILAAGAHKEWFVAPDRTIPLCRAHHRAYDAHELEILPALHLWEQLQVVMDLNGLQAALRRTAPLAYKSAHSRGGTEGGVDNQ